MVESARAHTGVRVLRCGRLIGMKEYALWQHDHDRAHSISACGCPASSLELHDKASSSCVTFLWSVAATNIARCTNTWRGRHGLPP